MPFESIRLRARPLLILCFSFVSSSGIVKEGCMNRPWRTHQKLVDSIMRAIAASETHIRDVVAAVTPGGGKSLLPVISAARLINAGVVDRVCWIVPRDTLRLQAEEAFADQAWRESLGHGVSVRAAENARDLTRGLRGYVTTYQAIAAAPDLHLAEFQHHRYLIALDEAHHLPALSDLDPFALASDETSWSRAIAPLLESARVRLLMSGTLERTDGRAILWLPYRTQPRTKSTKAVWRIHFNAPGWAIVGYSRRQAQAEKAILPVTFGAMEGEALWRPKKEGAAPLPEAPVSLSCEPPLAKYALYTALRTEFADIMLKEAFRKCREHRARRRREIGADPRDNPGGLGKLLVVASDQEVARRYLARLRSWMPAGTAGHAVRLAVSDERDAHEAIASFRLRPEPSILVTVAMAYEGMDCPEITHMATLTHIRSRPWLEQMIARATRVDPHGGPYDLQRATIYHPDDLLFRRFRHAIETEQGTRAWLPKDRQGNLFDREPVETDATRDWGLGIEPLESNATALHFLTVTPGPDYGDVKGAQGMAASSSGEPGRAAQKGLLKTSSETERQLRTRIGQMVAAQSIEDEDNNLVSAGPTGYHAYNAVLKRTLGDKRRSELSIEELEAAIGWLERNRIRDHLGLIADDTHYRWSSRRQRSTRHQAAAQRAKSRAGAAQTGKTG
jgi:superfamily II DNA or RNA helicase